VFDLFVHIGKQNGECLIYLFTLVNSTLSVLPEYESPIIDSNIKYTVVKLTTF